MVNLFTCWLIQDDVGVSRSLFMGWMKGKKALGELGQDSDRIGSKASHYLDEHEGSESWMLLSSKGVCYCSRL